MVIRDLLDRLEREREAHKAAVKRIDQMRDDILQTCREETKVKTLKGRKGASCQGQGEERKAA